MQRSLCHIPLYLAMASTLGASACESDHPVLFSEVSSEPKPSDSDRDPEPDWMGSATQPVRLEITPVPASRKPLPSSYGSNDDPSVDPSGDGEAGPPTILSVSPADGESGVQADTAIVIRFDASMDRALTEAAYRSESLPPDSVRFSWNDAGDELTITPAEPLEYASGTDPAAVEARRYGFEISASARDLDGAELAAPAAFSFSVLRQIEATLSPVQERDETGNWRSNDSYGNADCQQSRTTICVGDSYVDGAEQQYLGFVSFDVSSLPSELRSVARAELALEPSNIVDDPFAGLGALLLEHVSFDAIGTDAFTSDPLAELGPIAFRGELGGAIRADVSAAVAADLGERSMTQYRFRFEGETDGDNTSDVLMLEWSAQRLVVSYLIP